jgi:hypothetical protein
MAKKDKEFRLCYVDDNVMYFTDNFKGIYGDDWDDTPYEHNAEPPYEWNDNESDEWNVEHHHGHIRKIAFEHHWYIRRPCDGHLNSPYSVEDINKGAIAWLYSDEAGGLMAGSTMDEAIAWCRKGKIKWGELTE